MAAKLLAAICSLSFAHMCVCFSFETGVSCPVACCVWRQVDVQVCHDVR